MSLALNPGASPKPAKRAKRKKVKVESPDGRAEMDYVRQRDKGCVAQRAARLSGNDELTPCDGKIEVDHVRASGGLGMKSETVRTNLACLCTWHHKLKTDWGKVWRPMLLRYLDSVEPRA